jgi:hypothetical protein
LWIFLLPFTLVNVAGWVAPAAPSARRRLEQAGDLVLYAFGLSMTALLALWIAAISIDQIAVRGIFARTAESVSRFTWLVGAWPYIILGLCVVFAGAIIAGIVLLALAYTARYEGVGHQPEATPSLTGARIREQHHGLHDPRFWSSVADVRRLFGWHAATILAVMLFVVTFGIYRIGLFKELGLKGPAITEDFPWLFTIVTATQLTLLLLLLLLRLLAW